MSRVIAAAFATALVAAARSDRRFRRLLRLLHAAAVLPRSRCISKYVAPPQYRTVQETVMVSPGRVIAHRTPAQYRTVMVPQTVMVAPEGVAYRALAPQYATRERVEMVAPARTYYAPVAPRCSTCGY